MNYLMKIVHILKHMLITDTDKNFSIKCRAHYKTYTSIRRFTRKSIVERALLILFCVAEIAAFDKIENIYNYSIKSIIKSMVIRPLGPLDFLNRKLFNENKLTLNKRLLAIEIEPHSKLKISGLNLLEKNCSCKAEREMDTLCSNLSSHKYNFQSYMNSYHRALIIMFPSENNILSIRSSKRKSFLDFLENGLTKQKSMYILASLLLLSEGIDVPVTINSNDSEVFFKLDEITIGDSVIGIDINLKESIYDEPLKKKEKSVRSNILIILR